MGGRSSSPRGLRFPGTAAFAVLLVLGLWTVLPGLGPSGSPPLPSGLRSAHPFWESTRLGPVHPGGVRVHPGSGIGTPSYAGGSSEPAPMGMTDFGVTPGGQPYSYSTTSWLGTVHLASLKTKGGTVTSMTFQLNVVLVLQGASGNFSYWVQNVASIDTSSETIGFLNNIWNFSGPSAGLTSSEFAGNGTVNFLSGIGSWYAYGDGLSGNGNGYRMTFPTTVQAKVTTGIYNGMPHVDFLYNDGFGWISYDNVSFAHGGGWKDLGYVVDGYQYAPISPGLYTDGEWDFCGSGSGYKDILSNLTMGLQFWNGHNFQTPQNTWNFGGNTGESMSNVIPTLLTDGSNGNLTVQETDGSGATLGPLFGVSQVGTVSAYIPAYPTGTVRLGTGAHDYVGGRATITVVPGDYPISLWEGGTEIGVTGWANVTGGKTLFLELPIQIALFQVNFHSIGLPQGTSWGISLGGPPAPPANRTTGSWLNFTEPSRSYPYAILPVPGFSTPSYHSSVSVNGLNQTIAILWSPFDFRVTFLPSGMPTGIPWTVLLNGSTPAYGVGSNSVVAWLPNGTWTYQIDTVVWMSAFPRTDNITVAGAEVAQPLSFGPALSIVAGTLSPAGADLYIDGFPITGVGGDGAFRVQVAAGPQVRPASAAGFLPRSWNLTTTAGNTSATTLTLDSRVQPGGPAHPSSSSGTEWTYAFVGLGAVAAVAIAVLALALRRGPPPRGA